MRPSRRPRLATRRRALAKVEVAVVARAGGLDALHAALEQFWTVAGPIMPSAPDPSWRLRFDTAVVEIGTNIIRYAYSLGSRAGTFRLRLAAYADEVDACFSDRGRAFEPPALRPADADGPPLAEGGWGLALAQAAVDRLEYRRTPGGENCWRLTKHL